MSNEFNSFVVSATEGGQYFYLWKVFYPGGEVQPLTNGLANCGKFKSRHKSLRQKFDGSQSQPIYTTPEGEIFNFAWSKDGKKIVISRGQQFRDAVLLSEFE